MRAIRGHFDHLYAAGHSGLDEALQALLPPVLADPSIVALRSSAFLTKPGWARLLAQVNAAARQRAPAGPRMLDAGCGRGRVGRALAASIDASLAGIDFAHAAIVAARADQGQPVASFVVGDILHMPFAEASFDVVVCVDALHIVEQALAALAEIHRVLERGGVFIGSAYRLAGPGSYERRLDDWQGELERAGFRNPQMQDVTEEWRAAMREKHARRWAQRHELVAAFGERALRECDVSRQMLGVGGVPGFIALNERFEFWATKSRL